MPLTRLDNLITSKTGRYLYVSPDDFNASDELNNRGNSPVRPFKSIQRAFLEVARFSYLPNQKDRFSQFTIMLMPGEHYIDNRPGLANTSGIDVFGFDQSINEWTDSSILDLSNSENILYKFNNTEGGAIIPRGTSLVGYDLRRTMVKPLYVPDPADSGEARSAIFNVTGGCYFWQFTIRDGETGTYSPLYNSTKGTGEVYTSASDFTRKSAPNFSHHKLTVFEYADKPELDLLYQKVGKAFSGYQPTIDDPGEFETSIQENRIVGPLSDSRGIESIKLDDATTIPNLPGSVTQVEVTTTTDHGYFPKQFVAISDTNIDDVLEGTFEVFSIDATNTRKFIYRVPGTVNSIGSGIVSGNILTETSTPPLSQNAQVLAEVDTVESASPYVFNCSIRSTWGICGIWANGLKATGFKSVVIAQYTGVSLQRDDRAFIRYDEFTNTFNQASLTDALDSVPYHAKGDSYWKDEWRNFHVRASEDAFIQCVSIFAVGYADHFLMESGGDMSITNSNSNFGNTSLHAKGHKGYSFNSDKGGFIDGIIPPKVIETTDQKVNYYPFNGPACITGVEGVQQLPISGTRTRNDSRLYIDSQDDALDPAKRPAVSIDGYRLGARQDEKIFTKLETAYIGDDGNYESELAITGYKKYLAKPQVLSPASAPSGDPAFNKKQDAANLISANKVFIQEETFGYILEKYPALQNISYVNPSLDPAANRFQDARDLILANRSEIVNSAWTRTVETYPTHSSAEVKCKRDIGYVVDAIAEDLRDGGNSNIIAATKTFFNDDGTPLINGIVGEEDQAIYAFYRGADFAKKAIANLLTFKDNTITVDPSNSASTSFTPTGASYSPTTGDLVLTVNSHGLSGTSTYTATNAVYTPTTGVMTITIANHGFVAGDRVKIADNSLTFTCNQDGNVSQHTYPRTSDPSRGNWLAISNVTTNSFDVNVGASPEVTFTPTGVTYDAATGDLVLTIGSHTLVAGTNISINNNSLNFTCSMDDHGSVHSYPRITDPASQTSLPITAVTATSVTVNVGASPEVSHTVSNASYTPTTGDMDITIGDHNFRGYSSYTATDAAYNPTTGIVTLTVNNHGLVSGDKVKIANDSLTFTCAEDSNATNHTYPRASDPVSNSWISISNVTTNTFDVQVLSNVPSTNTTAHTFVSASANGITKAGDSLKIVDNSLTFTCAQDGNGSNHTYPRPQTDTVTAANADYNPITGILTFTITGHGLVNGDQIKIADDSLTFTCAQDGNGTNHTYPRATDPVSGKWLTISAATANTFEVQVLDTVPSTNTTAHTFVSASANGISTKRDPAQGTAVHVKSVGSTSHTVTNAAYAPSSGILALTIPGHGFSNGDRVKVTEGSLTFTCAKDSNATNHSYPRKTDPFYDEWLQISNVTTDQFEINVGVAGANGSSAHTFVSATASGLLKATGVITVNVGVSSNTTAHTFVSATADGIKSGGAYVHTFVSADTGAIVTGGNYTHTFVSATSNSITKQGDTLSIDNNALTFTCAMDGHATQHNYPRTSDPVSGEKLAIASTTNDTITVNVGTTALNSYTPSGATYDASNGNMVLTIGQHDLYAGTNIKIADDSLSFTCDMDGNFSTKTYPRSSDPVYGKPVEIVSVGSATKTATDAAYDPGTGVLTITIANHGYGNGDRVIIADGSLTFTCAKDNNATNHAYPRATDPCSGNWLPISGVTTNTFNVNIGISPDVSAHTFVSATADGITRQDGTITVNVGSSPLVNYTPTDATYTPTTGIMNLNIGAHGLEVGTAVKIADDSLTFTCAQDSNATQHTYPRPNIDNHTATNALYNPTTGILTLTVAGHGIRVGDWVKLDDDSLTFTCAQDGNGTNHTYPRSSDPISGKYIQVAAVTTDTFDIQVLNSAPSTNTTVHTFVSAVTNGIKQKRDRSYNTAVPITAVETTVHTVTGASYNPTTGIMTLTVNGHGFANGNKIKLADNSLTFTCAKDQNATNHTYPRTSDPSSGKWLTISNATTNTFDVQVLTTTPSTNTSTHTFVSAASGGLTRQTGVVSVNVGISSNTTAHTFVSAATNAVVTGGNYTHTFKSATTGAITGGGNYAHTFIKAAANGVKVYPAVVTNAASRNKDAYNLVTANKAAIITAAIAAIDAAYPSHAASGYTTKCERDLGLIIDAVLQDLWFGGNEYTISYLKTYFDGNALLSNGVQGEVPQTIVGLNKVQDQINLAINNQLASTDTSITLDNAADPAIVSDAHADAYNLLQSNKKFIAREAYERMKVAYPSYSVAAGYTMQDCLDDVYDVIRDLGYNIKFGGNHKTWDIGNGFATNNFNGVSLAMPVNERTEVKRVYTEAKDIAVSIIRNLTVTPTNWTPSGDSVQVTDTTIIADTNSPACQGIASAINTLFDIIEQGIGDDGGAGSVTSITRTEPTQPGSYTAGNCADVLNTVDTLIGLFIDSLNAGNLNDLPPISNGEWDCANVRTSIDNLVSIINDAIAAGSMTGLPALNFGDFKNNLSASKCYRDVGYIVDAVANDLKFGGNINSVQAGEAYYSGNNLDFINNEKNETIDAWGVVKNISISALRNHTQQLNGCNITLNSATINVGSNTGLAIGMKVEEYAPSSFNSDGQLTSGSAITTNIPAGTYIKQLVGNDSIEIGVENARLSTGNTVVATATNTNATLYFTFEKGQWADTIPSTDGSINSTGAGYPECAAVVSAVDTLVDNVIFVINNGINSVQRTEPTYSSSDYSSRSTLWTIDVTGAGSTNPHNFETGTPVRLVPRPRFDVGTSKYVDVDKRAVRLPNGFETNRTYYVIAPGRRTTPFNYSGSTEFNGSGNTNQNLMLAESKENAASGIYIYSAEADSIDPDVEIDLYQFVLDEKYDLHSYKVSLDGNINGGIKTNVAHIFDVPFANVTPQRVFFRQKDSVTNLPTLSATYSGDNATANGGDSTAGVADASGRLNPEYEFYVRFVYSAVYKNKVLCIYKTHADAINDVNRINFVAAQTMEFLLYASKKNAPLAFDPRGTAYSNSTTGRWFIKVKDTSSNGAGANGSNQDSILWRFQQSDFLLSVPPKSDDSYYNRQVDAREAKDRVYRVRYVIPKYLEGVRDPINGFVIKSRTDSLRKLKPQKILLKPAPGTTKTDAYFENTANAGERIGWTNQQIITALGDDANAYDPYRLDIEGQGITYPKKITTKIGKVQFTIQSAKLTNIDGDDFLEITAFDFTPDPTVASLADEYFRTVKITSPQGGSFVADSSQRTNDNKVTWAGNSSGTAYVQAYMSVGSDHYLILKGSAIDKNLVYSQYTNTRITQGTIFADVLDHPDAGKSLDLKDQIKNSLNKYYYKQNNAPVYQLTPGDTIKEDGSDNTYYIHSVEDAGEIEDTFYIYDVETLQRRIAKQQEGIYYLTLLRGNISPLPTGAGNQNNFREFKFSQPISFLYPQNYKNDPFWFKYNGTSSQEKALANTLIDPPATVCAADNYVHGLVRTNDSKANVTRETIADLTETPAFVANTYTGTNEIKAQIGNASAGAEDRLIPISGDNRVASQQRFYVELRRPSIARAGNHTFEYLGFGPGNYSTGLPARQEVVLTSTQDFYAQSKKEDGGIVFYTGINSNGELYIGNRKINAITGEEEFLERAQLVDSDDDEDDIGSLVTTFDVPVTFNQNITVNGGDGDKVSAFNAPILVSVDNADLTNQNTPLLIRSRVNNSNPDGSKNDPLLDRASFNPRETGDIFLGKNYVKAAVFQFSPRRNGQDYKIQTHTNGTLPTNIAPNQSGTYGVDPGGTAVNAAQKVFYGSGVNGVLPTGGDILLKGESVQRGGSLGWVFSNYFNAIVDNRINSLTFGGVYVKINWANTGGTQYTNQLLGITDTSSIRIKGFYPTPLLNGTFPIVSPAGDTFQLTNTYCHIQLSETLSSIVYNDATNTATTESNPAWSVLIDAAVRANNGNVPAPTMEFSSATWKEVGVIGADTIRSSTESQGDYKLGVNTVARASHTAHETAWVDAFTDPRANLDVVGTAFISGKTLTQTNFLDNALFANRTETAVNNAFLVGGDSATPDNAATLRISTTNNGRVGVNTTLAETTDSLTVKGTGKITSNLTVEADLAVNGGDITTTQTAFNLIDTTATTINFAGAATTANLFEDATGAQVINVGTSSTDTTFNLHTSSTDSTINLGTVTNSGNTAISLVKIGGARGNSAQSSFTVENYQTILNSKILEINNGLTSISTDPDDDIELQTNLRVVNLFTRNGTAATVNAFTKAVSIDFGAIAGQTKINHALNVQGDTSLYGDVKQVGGNNTGAVTVTRGQLGTTDVTHNIGDLNSLNVDHFSYSARFADELRFNPAAVSNNTLVVDNNLGPANYFVNGNIVQFTNVTGLSGVSVGLNYYVRDSSGQNFKLASTVGGSAIAITGTPTDARIILDGHKIDTSGSGGGGTAWAAGDTTLLLNNVNGLTVGDLILIENEIIRIAAPPSEANRSVVVQRGQFCTTDAAHADNTFIAGLVYTQDATFIREGNSGAGDTTLDAGATTIQLGEFGGTFKATDYLRLSADAGGACPSGEFVRIQSVVDASAETFIINDGASPTPANRLVVNSVTGAATSTLVAPPTLTGTEDFTVKLTTTYNRFVIESDTSGTEEIVFRRDGRITLIGDGTSSAPASILGETGSAAFTGDLWVTNTDATATSGNSASLDTGRLRLTQSSGDLDLAGGIDMDGDLKIYTGTTGINFSGTPKFSVTASSGDVAIGGDINLTGSINIGGIDNLITPTGGRKWLYIDDPSNTDATAPTLVANTNYFIKPSGTGVVLVLKLPTSPATGDMIRIIDLGGALSYNCQLVIRAATTVEVQGDATGTTLGGLGTAWTGGELIVNTPNVGLGLVYVGATDGANTTIASSDRGWRIVEV